jgi:hypothetical protein
VVEGVQRYRWVRDNWVEKKRRICKSKFKVKVSACVLAVGCSVGEVRLREKVEVRGER